MRKLDQADIETPMGHVAQVVEEDLAVGRGGQPARGRPQDAAHSDEVGPLTEQSGRSGRRDWSGRAGEEGDDAGRPRTAITAVSDCGRSRRPERASLGFAPGPMLCGVAGPVAAKIAARCGPSLRLEPPPKRSRRMISPVA